MERRCCRDCPTGVKAWRQAADDSVPAAALEGGSFYDDGDVFSTYMQHRAWPTNPNDTIEEPVFLGVLGDVRGHRVLDLGCGDARSGRYLVDAGARSYVGIIRQRTCSRGRRWNSPTTCSRCALTERGDGTRTGHHAEKGCFRSEAHCVFIEDSEPGISAPLPAAPASSADSSCANTVSRPTNGRLSA